MHVDPKKEAEVVVNSTDLGAEADSEEESSEDDEEEDEEQSIDEDVRAASYYFTHTHVACAERQLCKRTSRG